MAKMSISVVFNHLNEAIFLKSEDGKLSYCNGLAVKILQQTCQNAFENEN